MGRVDHHQHVELFRQLELRAEGLVFGLRLFVVADLADGHDALFGGEARQDGQHRLGERLVVGLLRVQADGAVVLDAELAGPEALPAHQRRQIVDVGVHAGARLTQPERRLDDRHDPRPRPWPS
jgi:hypothetical protein